MKSIEAASIFASQPTISLRNFSFVDGGVAMHELLILATIVKLKQPTLSFEIGTFDGNTTNQIAANAPYSADVYTLDLPKVSFTIAKPLDAADRKYINVAQTCARKYTDTFEARNIIELYGDSATFDYNSTLNGQTIDFAFIDGSHSYDYVKSDTENILPLMSPNGIVVWHDYQPCWPGVIRYLDERTDLNLTKINGTCMVYLGDIP